MPRIAITIKIKYIISHLLQNPISNYNSLFLNNKMPAAKETMVPTTPEMRHFIIPPTVSHAVIHWLILTVIPLIPKKFDGIHIAIS